MAWNWKSWERSGAFAIIGAALLCLVAIGIGGFSKSAPLGDDFHVFYRAGDLVLQGFDPWRALMDSPQPFSYPPHALSLFSFYATMPAGVALSLHLSISLLSIAAICYCADRWFARTASYARMTIPQALAFGLIIGNPYTATSLHQGQTTLLVTAGLLLSWLCLAHGHRIAAGVLLAVATLKPQLALFYVVWLVLSLEVGVLLVAGLVGCLMMLPAVVVLGLRGSIESWIGSLDSYAQVPINMPGSPYVVGLESFFVAHGVPTAAFVFPALGTMAVGALFLFRRHLQPFEIIQALLVASCTFLFVHDYDYVAIVLLWSYLLYVAASGVSLLRIALFAMLAFPFFLPQRLIRDIDLALVVHGRTLIVILALFTFLAWYHRRKVTSALETASPYRPKLV